MNGRLFLIPTLLGEGLPEYMLPPATLSQIRHICFFIVEDVRSARRFLSKVGIDNPINDLTFYTLNEHTLPKDVEGYLDAIAEHDIGVLSEAGVPGVADPGAEVVNLAHKRNIQVVPLIGPSSILLAVMASGLNGQSFAFNGYLPVKNPDRINKIRAFEKRSITECQTQVFIETPYRNNQLFDDLMTTCLPATLIGIAADITLETEFIRTLPVSEWKKQKPELHKRPAIFLIGK